MNPKRDNHPMELSRPVPTFCDVCNKIAFGLLLQCSNCKLICHKACQSKILFHCQSDLERTLQSGRQKVRFFTLGYSDLFFQEKSEIRRQSPEEQYDTIKRTLNPKQISNRIENYNRSVKNKLLMTLRSDYSFTGFIR